MSNLLPVIGYLVVDSETHKIDWDCELHRTHEQALESLCSPRQMYVRTQAEADESAGEKTYWAEHYNICTVRTA